MATSMPELLKRPRFEQFALRSRIIPDAPGVDSPKRRKAVGLAACIEYVHNRTIGGHRRILVQDVLEMVRRDKLPHMDLSVLGAVGVSHPVNLVELKQQLEHALRSSGVGVSIDDFGTGNASIGYLAKLPASEIKLDRSFITDICEDARAEAIVRSTVDFARHLHLRVVAEVGRSTARLIANQASLKTRSGEVQALVTKLRSAAR